MTRAIRSEFLKVVTTRLLVWFALMVGGLIGLSLSLRIANGNAADLALSTTQHGVLQFAAIAVVVSVLLGTLVAVTDYEFGTIVPTFLVTPARERVVAAKVVVAAVLGLALGLFAELVTLAIAAPWLSSIGSGLRLGESEDRRILLGILVASVLASVLGAGLGLLLRRQTATIVLALVWLLIGEATIGVIGKNARYSPGRAFGGLVSGGSGRSDQLGMGAGGGVALAYAALFVALGLLAVRSRDVD